MSTYAYGSNGRIYRRWLGWRNEQPERYPLTIIRTGHRQPAPERLSLSRCSDTPRRVIPPPAEAPNPRALVLHWFNDDGSVGFTADGSAA